MLTCCVPYENVDVYENRCCSNGLAFLPHRCCNFLAQFFMWRDALAQEIVCTVHYSTCLVQKPIRAQYLYAVLILYKINWRYVLYKIKWIYVYQVQTYNTCNILCNNYSTSKTRLLTSRAQGPQGSTIESKQINNARIRCTAPQCTLIERLRDWVIL